MTARPGKHPAIANRGFTLVEMLVSVAIAAVLIVSLSAVIDSGLMAYSNSASQHDALQQARFAMQRMTYAVRHSPRLLVPLNENPNTTWTESIRNVLAVSLEVTLDNNKDGWADANNDRDYLDINNNGSRDTGEPERIDEDLDRDNTNDGAPGIIGIDDDGDGNADEANKHDNDEDGQTAEDSIDGLDNDNDGELDEDIDKDMNNDGIAGVAGLDDDYDLQTDEGENDDDDEDGQISEDWLDPHVFYLQGNQLKERLPTLNPANGASYNEYVIADNVTQFRVENIIPSNVNRTLVDISLTISPALGNPVTLNSRIQLGGGL